MPTAFPAESDLFPAGALAPATAKTKWQQFFQAVTALLGTTGDTATARTALGAAGLSDIKQITPVTASVASSALTLTLSPCQLDFRSATMTSGTVNQRTVGSATSIVVPSGATLGTVNGQAARLAILAIDNAGTVELAVTNLAGGLNLDECGVISTTALSTAADSANVIYSTTARSNVAYRVVGFVDITEATAGTWATAPSVIQGCGGQALTAMQSLGFGQTWQSVTRGSGVTYYNTSGKPRQLHFSGVGAGALGGITLSVNGGAAFTLIQVSAGTGYGISVIIPAGVSYVVTDSNISTRNSYEML